MTRPSCLVLLAALGLGAPLAAGPMSGGQASAPQPADLENAVRAYRGHLARDPGDVKARSNLGAVLAALGRHGEAIEAYKEALALAPADAVVRMNLALAYYKSADIPQAAGELDTLHRGQPDDLRTTLLLADCRLRLGEYEAVVALLRPVEAADPENQAVLYMLGTALMRDRQYERGQRVLDRILRQGDSAEAHLVLAIASREANDDIAAEKELRRALELQPKLPTANGILGDVLVRMGEGTAAVDYLRRELEVNPNHFDSHLLLGLLLRQDGRNDEAMEHLRRAIALRPGDPGVRYQTALVQIAKGETEAARETLVALVAEQPAFSEAHVSLATVYYRLGRREDGNRHQAIVQQLKRDQQAREDAERARQQGQAPPP